MGHTCTPFLAAGMLRLVIVVVVVVVFLCMSRNVIVVLWRLTTKLLCSGSEPKSDPKFDPCGPNKVVAA